MNGTNALRLIYPVVGIALIVAVWHFYIVEFDIPGIVMPLPGLVLDAIIENWADLFIEGWVTFLECVYGFALAVVIGIPIAARVVPKQSGDKYAPSVDRLFESAAKSFGRDLLSVVLTGMGNDGRRGRG